MCKLKKIFVFLYVHFYYLYNLSRLMRFKVTFRVNKNAYGNELPISYQYELSAWIYSVIAKSDNLYASWLHDNGFSNYNRRFKMFAYSNLSPHCKVIGDRMVIQNETMHFILSFLPEKSTEKFVKGIFAENRFALGDKRSRVQFQVDSIEILPIPAQFGKSYEFQTLSPVVISTKRDDGTIEYLSPEGDGYGKLLINNLKQKYSAFYEKPFDGDEYFEFKLTSLIRPRLITIKADTPKMTKVKGFNYKFKLSADYRLIQIMYEAGLGEKNAIGFGMVE